MIGDTGPYMNDEGDIWVPRTVPYLEAREIAKEGFDSEYYRLVYVGKDEADLLGFTRDCRCEEQCHGGPVDRFGDSTPLPECRVPAWHFAVGDR